MKPQYSVEDRYKIVMNFISLRGKGQIPIVDFTPLIRYLNDKEIVLLHEIKKTGYEEIYDPNGTIRQPVFPELRVTSNVPHKVVPCISREDAEEYFNWLIWIVTVDEKASDEKRKEAINQLFLFIFALRDKIHVDLNSLLKVSFEWEDRIDSFERELIELKTRLENSNNYYDRKLDELKDDLKDETEKIANVLEKIGNWQKEYQPCLNRLEEEQDGIDRVLNGEKSGKKRKH